MLSPDRTQLAFVEANLSQGLRYLPRVVTIAGGGVSAAAVLPARQALGATWPPAGAVPQFGLEPSGTRGGVSAQSGSGFDVPLGYSRDGSALAVRHWSGASFAEAGSGAAGDRKRGGPAAAHGLHKVLRMGRALAALGVAAAVLALAVSGSGGGGARAQEACFSPEPFNFLTYEAYDNAGVYLTAIELAAAGEAVLSPATISGEQHGLEYPGLLSGTQEERVDQEPDVSRRIPPTLIKAIVWVESSFQQAHQDIPWGGVGRTVRSFDCGFGLGQITSGMENTTGNASAGQALTGTHFLFNLAASASILAGKWNSEFVPIAGKGDPTALEDWYYALWAYNGLAYLNHPLFDTAHAFDWIDHPLHPWRDPLRGEVFHCRDESSPSWVDAGDGTPLYDYGDYTYPERIYGCMRHPPEYPSRLYEDEAYAPTPWPAPPPAATPTPAETPTPTAEADEGEDPEDGEETSVTEAPEETSSPSPSPSPSPVASSAATPVPWPGGIPRLWRPVQVNLPDLRIPEVAAAFAPNVFIPCEDEGFAEGCPGMAFPTSFPELGIEPHRDPTPPADPRARSELLGRPSLEIRGPDEVRLSTSGGSSEQIILQNVGTWIAPFRVWTTAPWIVVRSGEDGGHIHGGVAIGAETEVVILAETEEQEKVAKQGHVATLVITLDREALPASDALGAVFIEPLIGTGMLKRITVRAGAGTPANTPEPEETPEPEPSRQYPSRQYIVIPGIAVNP